MVSLIKSSQVTLVLLSCLGAILKTTPEETLEGRKRPPRVSPQVPPPSRCLPTGCPHTLGVLLGCPMYPHSGYPPLGVPTMLGVTPRGSVLGVPQYPRPQVTPPYQVSPPRGSPLRVPPVFPPLGCPPGCPHPSDLLIHRFWSVSFLSVQNAPTSLTLTGEKLAPEVAAGALPSLG